MGAARTDLTAEGTVLGASEEAVLQNNAGFDPEGDYYTQAQFVSRLTEIIPAAAEDFTAADGSNPVDPATEDAYYVWTEHTLVWARGNTPLTSVPSPSVHAWTADGAGASWIFGIGLEKCTGSSIDDVVVGAVGTACNAVVVPKGQAISHVGVLGNPDITRDAHEDVTSQQVLWAVGG